VLLSHLHGDHFDAEARRQLPPTLPVITTPQAARRLIRQDFEAVRGLPAWHPHEARRGTQRLRVTAVPGRHAPGPAGVLLPDVMGSILELSAGRRHLLRVYITGDTVFGGHLEQIPRHFGAIDVMLIHLGGARLLGLPMTMDGRQGVELTRLIRPALTIPVHFDDYQVFTSPLSDYLDRARAAGLGGIHPVERGDTVDLPLRRVSSAGSGRPGRYRP
jgi:L-ascorbate metabolism protein UlaG (beta-lactamase superfamily)